MTTPSETRQGPDTANELAHQLPFVWRDRLAEELAKPYFQALQTFVAQEREAHSIFPEPNHVFTAFHLTPPERVRVVLFGQDPYPTPGHAHGLAFSVRPGVAPPASLRNMYKELQSDLGIPPVKHGMLRSWAEQGVLLLNSVLTVRSGEAGSHARRGWETFTDACLQILNQSHQPIVFLLWGGFAAKKQPLIDESRHVVLLSAHPSPLSASKGFFGSRPFSRTNAALEARGLPPIQWKLPETPNPAA